MVVWRTQNRQNGHRNVVRVRGFPLKLFATWLGLATVNLVEQQSRNSASRPLLGCPGRTVLSPGLYQWSCLDHWVENVRLGIAGPGRDTERSLRDQNTANAKPENGSSRDRTKLSSIVSSINLVEQSVTRVSTASHRGPQRRRTPSVLRTARCAPVIVRPVRTARPDLDHGCSLKKKWGTPETRLRQRFFKQFRLTYTYAHTRQKNCHSGSLVLSCDTATRV